MMHKTPLMRMVHKGVKLVVALTAISVGLTPFGWNFFHSATFVTSFSFMYYVILLAGLMSFACFSMACASGSCD